MSLPPYASKLSMPVQTNNFTPIQSAQLAVTAVEDSVTFTLVPGKAGVRTTFKITNTGDDGCYVATGIGSATAVVATATPTPAAGVDNAVATCDYIAGGAIITQDYMPGTDTISAICGGSDSTTLEISIGYGQ